MREFSGLLIGWGIKGEGFENFVIFRDFSFGGGLD